MYLQLFLIAIGFVMLVKGADYLVKGATFVAQRLGVSYFIIGLTIVAFGTSLPEFIVGIISAFKGTTDIAVGNIIGSNMANMLLIVGIMAVLIPLDINIYAKKRDIPYALFSSMLLLFISIDVLLFGSGKNVISRIDGIILISAFVLFLIFVLSRSRDEIVDEGIYDANYKPSKALLFILTGVLALYLGGEIIVENSISLARQLSISEILISSTIVAFGTSLPEFATSIIAAYKAQCDIAVGNIVGSNIFNVLWVLGVTSIIIPLPLDGHLIMDMGLMVIATFTLLLMVYVGIENIISWPKGLTLLLFYAIYIAMLIIRG
ncbi:MAG: calcium/sodium antiporter [Candidatus Methanofastidiosa archaeon]|nr:calcium/sodium antiporter [Candidatus Methanofastidiosa archaeon]